MKNSNIIKIFLLILCFALLISCGKDNSKNNVEVENTPSEASSTKESKEEVSKENRVIKNSPESLVILNDKSFENIEIEVDRASSLIKDKNSTEGIAMEDFQVEIINENTSGSQYSDSGKVALKDSKGNLKYIFEVDNPPALINELVCNEEYIAWCYFDGKTTDIYLYDIKNKGTKIIKSYEDLKTILLSMDKNHLVVRNEKEIFLYDISKEKINEITRNISAKNPYDRPETSDGYIVFQAEDKINLFDINEFKNTEYSFEKNIDIFTLKGNNNIFLWKEALVSTNKLYGYNLENDKYFLIEMKDPIFSYHISGEKIFINSSKKIYVYDIKDKTIGVFSASQDKFLSYGKVLSNGVVQFSESDVEDLEYLNFK